MQRSASDDLKANRTALATSILRSSEPVASAIANTINNNAITVSRPNFGSCMLYTYNTHLQQTHAVSCKDMDIFTRCILLDILQQWLSSDSQWTVLLGRGMILIGNIQTHLSL